MVTALRHHRPVNMSAQGAAVSNKNNKNNQRKEQAKSLAWWKRRPTTRAEYLALILLGIVVIGGLVFVLFPYIEWIFWRMSGAGV